MPFVTPAPSLLDKLWFRRLLQGATLLLFCTMVFGIYTNARDDVPMYIDFLTLIASPRAHLQGVGLYSLFLYAPALHDILFLNMPPLGDVGPLSHNLNPPIISGFLYPLAFVSLRSAFFILCGVQLVLMIVVLWRVLLRCLGPQKMPFWLAVFLSSAYFPVSANMVLGQIGLFPLILLGLFWLALERNRPRQAALWLGLALVCKVFVGLIFVWLLLRRRWLVLLWASLVWCALMLTGLLVFGLQNHLDWITNIQTMNWGVQTWNASLFGFSARQFGGTVMDSHFNWPWARFAVRSLGLIGAATALIWLSRQQVLLGERRTLNLGLALCLPLMLLLTPLGWIYYFPLLLLGGAIVWQESAAFAALKSARHILILTFMLSGIPQLMSGVDAHIPSLWRDFKSGLSYTTQNGQLVAEYDTKFSWFVLPDVYTAALLLMSGCILWISWRLAQSAKSAQTGT